MGTSNFHFLSEKWDILANLGETAETEENAIHLLKEVLQEQRKSQ